MLDHHPNLMLEENFILEKVHRAAKRFSFREYDSPLLEPWEVFAKKSSNEILEKQAYTFIDKGGRKLILKPEITPPLARLVSRYGDVYSLPLKWYTIGKCYRYENPQKGRLREFKQVNFDIISEGKHFYLQECLIITLIISLFELFNIKRSDYKVLFNHRGMVDDLLNYFDFDQNEKKNFYSIVDRKNKLTSEEFKKVLENNFKQTKQLDFINDYLSEQDPLSLYKKYPIAPNDDLVRFLDLIHQEREVVVFSPEIVRGFDYYSGLVFEVYATGGGIKRSLFGGGRYDGLVEKYGNKSLIGVGFGMGMPIFNLFLKELDLMRSNFLKSEIDYYIAPLEETSFAYCLQIRKELCEKDPNISVDIGLPSSVKKHFKMAEKKKINHFIFVGEEEVKRKNYEVKKIIA